MASVEVKFTDNSDKFLRRLGLAEEVVKKYAFDVEGNAKAAIMSGAKTGRVYGGSGGGRDAKGRFLKQRKAHQASAPGQAPATDTGKLVNSIHAKKESRFVWVVGVGAKYGKALELGTRRMAPRPFLLPALKKVERSFLAAIEAIFRD